MSRRLFDQGLSRDDVVAVAERLSVRPEAVHAVAEVESGPWGAFLPDGHPVVLFERHLFSRFTGGRWDAERPALSNRRPGRYGKVSAQPRRLAAAKRLDHDAAIRATSWGLFQILGDNYVAAGFRSLGEMEAAMRSGVRAHLEAFGSFVYLHSKMLDALRREDWREFARRYNGPGHERHNYAGRIGSAFRSIIAEGLYLAPG